MPTKLVLNGMSEFRAALRNLPAELAAEADGIVQSTANESKREIVDRYPTQTGNLKDGVSVRRSPGRFGSSAVVRSGAPHASIYEHGTGRRQTARGFNRGRMPKADPAKRAMVPVVVRKRSEMARKLIRLVERAGFQVNVE